MLFRSESEHAQWSARGSDPPPRTLGPPHGQARVGAAQPEGDERQAQGGDGPAARAIPGQGRAEVVGARCEQEQKDGRDEWNPSDDAFAVFEKGRDNKAGAQEERGEQQGDDDLACSLADTGA